MRSIGYILGGRPTSTADCLDHAHRRKLDRIILTLRTVEEAADEYIVRWLRGSLTWFFEDTTVTYDVTFGGCFMHEPPERQRLSVDNANARLEHELATIGQADLNVPVQGAEARFDYSAIYSARHRTEV